MHCSFSARIPKKAKKKICSKQLTILLKIPTSEGNMLIINKTELI
jgi:hypothetical protein